MAKAVVLLFLPLLFLQPFSSLALTQDFCVADLTSRDTPAGYPCKRQADVTASDFFYGGLSKPGKTSLTPFNIRISTAFVDEFPGLNGLDISGGRVDIVPGGVAPLHTHPEGSELFYLLEGTMVAGFISSAGNTAYMTALNKGDLFVVPRGLLHFQYNNGTETATGISAFSSANPGIQIVDFALFKSTLPADVVKNVTFLQLKEVKRLKGVFGGSG